MGSVVVPSNAASAGLPACIVASCMDVPSNMTVMTMFHGKQIIQMRQHSYITYRSASNFTGEAVPQQVCRVLWWVNEPQKPLAGLHK